MDKHIEEIIKTEIYIKKILNLSDEKFAKRVEKYIEECEKTNFSYLQFLEGVIKTLEWMQREKQEPIDLIEL